MAGLWTQLTIVALFLGLNITFNMYNKYLFTKGSNGAGFQVPVLATMSHALAGFGSALLLSRFPRVYTRKRLYTPSAYLSIVAISVFFSAGIALSNSSLQYISLSLQQVVKATSPVVVAVCVYALEGRAISCPHMLSLGVLVLGVAMAVLGSEDIKESGLVGVAMCFASVIAGALQYTFVSINMGPEKRLGALDLLLYTSLPTVVILTPAFLVNREVSKLQQYAEEHGWDVAVGWIVLGQVLAVCYNLTVFTFIKVMSAVYISVCGVFKVVLIILFSLAAFDESIGVVTGCGLAIAMVAFAGNSYFEFQSKQSSPALPADVDDEEREGLLERSAHPARSARAPQ